MINMKVYKLYQKNNTIRLRWHTLHLFQHVLQPHLYFHFTSMMYQLEFPIKSKTPLLGLLISSKRVLPVYLFKIFNTCFKDFHILFPININSYPFSAALYMCHLAKTSSIRRSNALDCCIRTIYIPLLIHRDISVKIYILCCYLSICKKFINPLLGCNKPSFPMRSGNHICLSKFCELQPW